MKPPAETRKAAASSGGGKKSAGERFFSQVPAGVFNCIVQHLILEPDFVHLQEAIVSNTRGAKSSGRLRWEKELRPSVQNAGQLLKLFISKAAVYWTIFDRNIDCRDWELKLPNPDFKYNGRTSFMQCCAEGDMRMSRLIVDRTQVDVQFACKDKWTPLHFATYWNRMTAVKFLLEQGAELDAVDKHLWTPLHIAAHYGYLPIVKLFCYRGANRWAKDNFEKTPLKLAIAHGINDEVIEFLRSVQYVKVLSPWTEPECDPKEEHEVLDISLGHGHYQDEFWTPYRAPVQPLTVQEQIALAQNRGKKGKGKGGKGKVKEPEPIKEPVKEKEEEEDDDGYGSGWEEEESSPYY